MGVSAVPAPPLAPFVSLAIGLIGLHYWFCSSYLVL